jgi:hypothetical protein
MQPRPAIAPQPLLYSAHWAQALTGGVRCLNIIPSRTRAESTPPFATRIAPCVRSGHTCTAGGGHVTKANAAAVFIQPARGRNGAHNAPTTVRHAKPRVLLLNQGGSGPPSRPLPSCDTFAVLVSVAPAMVVRQWRLISLSYRVRSFAASPTMARLHSPFLHPAAGASLAWLAVRDASSGQPLIAAIFARRSACRRLRPLPYGPKPLLPHPAASCSELSDGHDCSRRPAGRRRLVRPPARHLCDLRRGCGATIMQRARIGTPAIREHQQPRPRAGSCDRG